MDLFLEDLCQWLHKVPFSKNQLFTGVSTDTGTVQKGHLFFALRGARVDGHSFVQKAISLGASSVVVERGFSEKVDVPCFYVEDTRKALQEIAKNAFSSMRTKVIALTGSFGKTTTKEWIAQLLSEKYRVGATLGNQNSQVGLPLTLLNGVRGDEEYLVLEMGMTEKGEIRRLTEITPPDIACITGIGLVHAENFTSIEDIALAKRELLEHPKVQLGFVNKEAQAFSTIIATTKAAIHTYGSPLSGAMSTLERMNEMWCFRQEGVEKSFLIPGLHAKHLAVNCAGAIALARACGLEWEEIGRGLGKITSFMHRMEKKEKDGITFIDDSYNASGMRAALIHMREEFPERRKIAVLGGMRELGAFHAQEHLIIAKEAIESVDYLFCYGDSAKIYFEVFEQEKRPSCYTEDFEELKEKLYAMLQKDDVVLLKGKQPCGLWRLLEEKV